MIQFKTISSFREGIADLLKVKRGVYEGINDEIKREFESKTIEEIRINRDLILLQDEAVIIKLRLPDKKQRLSRKDGFRLIYYVSKIEPLVIFLNVYPKNGPLQKLNLKPEELKRLLIELIEEAQNNLLESYTPLTPPPEEIPS